MRGLGPGQNCFSHRVQGPQRDGSSATGNPLPWKKSFQPVFSCAVQTLCYLEAELEFPEPSTPHVDFLSQEGFRRKIRCAMFVKIPRYSAECWLQHCNLGWCCEKYQWLRGDQVHCFRGCHGENPAVLVPAGESFQEDQGCCSQAGF